jgi:thiopeptide-type bacteriocin biosynthesis protein
LTIDEFLSACFLDDSARLDWLKRTVTWAKEVRDEYRGRRKDIIAALSDPSLLHQPIRDALALYHAESAAATERLVELDASNVLTQPASALYSSYIHMHCNRITSDQTSERRAMGLLLRARDAMAHRGKRSAEPQEASTVEFAHDNS